MIAPLAILSLLATSASARLSPHLAATIPVKNAAVTAVADAYPGSKGPALLVTTFAAFGAEPVSSVSNLAAVTHGAGASVQQLEDSTTWTNYIGMAPTEVGDAIVSTAGGFLVPGHSTGTINLFDVTDPSAPKNTQVSTDKKGWFYHKIVWYDVDGDGLLDIIAARATAPKPIGGELIWLKQPANNASSTPAWKETVITQGPDVDFIVEDLDGDGMPEVVAAQFFSAERLAVYACAEKSWSACVNGSGVTSSVIDDVNGPFFTVRAVDLDNDGKLDLLASNNQADGSGSVFAYELMAGGAGPTAAGGSSSSSSSSSSTGSWTRHELATGFTPVPSLIPSPGAHSRGSPGMAMPFHINIESASKAKAKAGRGREKPQILLSGDDGGFFALLRPTTEAAGEWGYSVEYITNSSGTVGSPSVADLDGDGVAELILPFYSDGKIEIYNFSDAAPAPVSAQCRACLAKKDPVHLSPAYAWCYKDATCHLVGSVTNPCAKTECTSAAKASQCRCTACNDAACSSVAVVV